MTQEEELQLHRQIDELKVEKYGNERKFTGIFVAMLVVVMVVTLGLAMYFNGKVGGYEQFYNILNKFPILVVLVTLTPVFFMEWEERKIKKKVEQLYEEYGTDEITQKVFIQYTTSELKREKALSTLEEMDLETLEQMVEEYKQAEE